jgi:hypothetical protein
MQGSSYQLSAISYQRSELKAEKTPGRYQTRQTV